MDKNYMAYKSIKAGDGLVVLVERSPVKVSKTDISITVLDFFISVMVGDIIIPLTDDLLPHLLENPKIIICFTDYYRYYETNLLIIDLDKSALLEAKGVWGYKKMIKAGSEIEDAESVTPEKQLSAG